MKRSFFALTLALGAILVASGCQAGSTSTPTAGPTDTPGASPADSPVASASAETVTEITLLWGFTGGDRAAYDKMIETFNATHPNVQVKLDVQPWDAIKATTPAAFASGQGPDIVTPDYNEATVLEYAKAGTILALDELLGTGENQVDPAALPKAVTDSFSVDGTLYAIPSNFRTLMLYYNKALFEEAGIANPPATMDELRAVAKQLTGNGNYGIAIPDHETIAVWPILIWAEGGEIVGSDGCSAFDSEATVAAVQKWADAMTTDEISPVGLSGQDAGNLFAAGKAAMEINGPWEIGLHTEAGIDFDVAPVPSGPGGSVTLSSAVPFVVNKSTQHKEAVYEFLAWWSGQDGQRQLAVDAGEPPARTDMNDDPGLTANPWVVKFTGVVADARPFLATAPNFAQVNELFYEAIGLVERGDPVAATLADASSRMNALLGCQ